MEHILLNFHMMRNEQIHTPYFTLLLMSYLLIVPEL
jgi:hypothetical protein